MAKRLFEIDREIGKRIREFRKIRGVTQTDIADALGITFQQVQKYENGVNRVSVSTMIGICKALNITPMDVVGTYFGNDDTPSTSGLLAEVKMLRSRLSDIQQLCA